MKENYRGTNGTTVKIVSEAIRKKDKKKNLKQNKKIKKTQRYGSLKSKDLKNIALGLDVLAKVMGDAIGKEELKMLSGEKDVSKAKKELVEYKEVINRIIKKLAYSADNEYSIKSRVESLGDYSKIVQAARDGIIIKQESRKEIKGKETKEIIYDTSMTPREVIDIVYEYKKQLDRIQHERLNNYLALGLGVSGMIGALIKRSNTIENKDKKGTGLITTGTIITTGLRLIQGIIKENEIEMYYQMNDKQRRLENDLFANEQISTGAEVDAIRLIENMAEERIKLVHKIDRNKFKSSIIIDLAIAVMSGMYINKNIQMKDNGKIDGASLASALISLREAKGIAGNFFNFAQGLQNAQKSEEEFKEICKKVNQIYKQMEEKVYPLKGAEKPFESVKIQNLEGMFYPKKNYKTGEVEFSTKIKIPEFSMERGDVVLLSGESGTGKSTFLRLLKRGDINNRGCITLDNGEKVDNLGSEYISFRPSINLGDETNVLYQLTGKSNISDLSKKERENLREILTELNLNVPNLLEQLASKKFMEFSTGQQRRLALSKLFYRIDDGTSVIIVDEPVGNVEDKLIREQLELIRKYAKEKNVMLLLTTHRLDLAQDLATKRYHIDKNGELKRVSVKENKSTDEIEID